MIGFVRKGFNTMNIYRSVVLARNVEEDQDFEETVYVGAVLKDAISEIELFISHYSKLLIDGKFIEIWRDGKYIDALKGDGTEFDYVN